MSFQDNEGVEPGNNTLNIQSKPEEMNMNSQCLPTAIDSDQDGAVTKSVRGNITDTAELLTVSNQMSVEESYSFTVLEHDKHLSREMEGIALGLGQPVGNIEGFQSENAATHEQRGSNECEKSERDETSKIGSSESISEITATHENCADNREQHDQQQDQMTAVHTNLELDAVCVTEGLMDMETDEISRIQDEYVTSIQYNFDAVPEQLTGAWQEFEHKTGNFLKGCKWSPDGCCLLTNSEDSVLRIFNLPAELYSSEPAENFTQMASVLRMQEGETVYDYCWYPYMSSLDPDTCCLLSTSRDHPVHMWDAFTGELRCSYKSYNHLDEVVAATSVAFSLDGSHIYCGFNKMVRVFDTNRPGREYQERPTVVKKYGQSGIISCIAFCPDNSGLYALGSYSKSVGIYSEADGELLCLLQGQSGGITHVMFSPDGSRLYSGGRKDDEILCWDIRNPGTVLYRLIRPVATNQRIYFDIDRCGRYLVSGGADGTVTVWDTTSSPVYEERSSEPTLKPLTSYAAHGDCVNGASFHPSLPLLATSSGQRKFPIPNVTDDDSDEEETADQDTDVLEDNSIRLWRLG